MEQLEAEINPALDEDPLVALSYLFTKAIDTMKANPEVCGPILACLPACLSVSFCIYADMDVP